MNQHEIIAGRLEYSRAWLNSVLPRLTQEMLPWAPTEGMRTVAGQLVEIIWVEAQLVPALKGGKLLTDDELSAICSEGSGLDELLAALTTVRTQTLQHLNDLSEANLAANVMLPQWYGAYWPKPGPCGEHFRNIAEHEFYHVGQLMSYLWAKGDNPYEW